MNEYTVSTLLGILIVLLVWAPVRLAQWHRRRAIARRVAELRRMTDPLLETDKDTIWTNIQRLRREVRIARQRVRCASGVEARRQSLRVTH